MCVKRNLLATVDGEATNEMCSRLKDKVTDILLKVMISGTKKIVC